jgi:hypothetical protein
MVVAYEFYWRDPKKGHQLIGVFPEVRKDPKRITQRSIISLGKKILGKKVDVNEIFFIKITKYKATGRIQWLNSVYRPLKELKK